MTGEAERLTLLINVFPALKDGDFSSGAKLPTEIFGTSQKT